MHQATPPESLIYNLNHEQLEIESVTMCVLYKALLKMSPPIQVHEQAWLNINIRYQKVI